MHVYYTGEVLIVNIQNVTEGGQSHLRVRLQCESMDLAAELIPVSYTHLTLPTICSV